MKIVKIKHLGGGRYLVPIKNEKGASATLETPSKSEALEIICAEYDNHEGHIAVVFYNDGESPYGERES